MLAPLPAVVLGLEVRLGALSCPPSQASLFEGEKAEKVERPRRLRAALESVESRFSGQSGRYVPDELDGPFPEEQWRFDPVGGWLSALETLNDERKERSGKGHPGTERLGQRGPR